MGIFDRLLNDAEEDGDDRHFEEMVSDPSFSALRPVKTRSERKLRGGRSSTSGPLSKVVFQPLRG